HHRRIFGMIAAGGIILAFATPLSHAQKASTAAASKSAGTVPEATLRAVSEEVYLDMVARDRHGKTVRDLASDQFEVYEDGVRQKIISFRFVAGQPGTEVTPREGTESDLLRGVTLVS